MDDDTDLLQTEIGVGGHRAVGPMSNVYGHGLVVLVGSELSICLDCGYVVEDIRSLAHVECDADANPIRQTFRSWLVEQVPAEVKDDVWEL